MLRSALFILPVAIWCLFGSAEAQTFNYEITSGNISAAEGSITTGPAETLSGTFSLTYDPENSTSDITAYEVTALNFTSSTFSFVVGPAPYGITETLPGSTISFGALAQASGTISGAYSLDSIIEGVYGTYNPGEPGPTNIYLADIGVAPSSGGDYVANIGILDATLVSTGVREPSIFDLFALGLLIVAGAARFSTCASTPFRVATPAAG